MIKHPKAGMRVSVDERKCCCGLIEKENHNGDGMITEIDEKDSFTVKMDSFDEEWWRCCDCVTEI